MHCIICHLPLKLPWGICSQCRQHLPTLLSTCQKCGLPLFPAHKRCHYCIKIKPNWDNLIAVADYAPPFIKFIYQFKLNKKTELAYPLARLMLISWLRTRHETGLLKPDIITCIPLHHSRYWSRGYNQSQLLARYISHWIGSEFNPYLLNRISKGRDQKILSKQQRILNTHQIFRCDTPLSGKSIAIIDDIVTTGNTISEACKQLKSQGAKHVQVICLCRTSL